MPFELFTGQRPVILEPAITIQKKGAISLNRAAYAALGSPEAAELLFDPEERQVGIRKADPSAAHAMPVRPLGERGSSWLISGRSFAIYYGIPVDTARRWLAQVVDGMLVIDLKEPGTDVSGVRHRARQADPAGTG
jgi:hypothetical protein